MRPSPRLVDRVIRLGNVTPPWLLPYWRVWKTEASGDYALAYNLLNTRMLGVPSREEVALVLLKNGLV
jgi:hypothetical protein